MVLGWWVYELVRWRVGAGVGGVKVIQAYRFALDPSAAQERALRSHAGAARFAWNWGLGKCQERYAAEEKWYSAVDLHRLWNAVKKADPALAWWAQNSKCSYQEAFRDLDRALRDFTASPGRAAEGQTAGVPPVQEAREVPGLVPVRFRCHALFRGGSDPAAAGCCPHA
jgi:Helix-turn-helix domain